MYHLTVNETVVSVGTLEDMTRAYHAVVNVLSLCDLVFGIDLAIVDDDGNGRGKVMIFKEVSASDPK